MASFVMPCGWTSPSTARSLCFLKICCTILLGQCTVDCRRCAALGTVSGSCTRPLGFLETMCRLTLFSSCILNLLQASCRETVQTHHSANMSGEQRGPLHAVFWWCPPVLAAVAADAVAGSAHELRCPELRCCAELNKRVHRTRPSLLPQTELQALCECVQILPPC